MRIYLLVLLASLGTVAAGAQPATTVAAQATNSMPARFEQAGQGTIRVLRRPIDERTAQLPEVKPNEIRTPAISADGIAVQAVKSGNLLQLINPFAPARYGKAEDNVVQDDVTGRIVGLKFLSIHF